MNKVASGYFSLRALGDAGKHVEYNWWHSFDHQPEMAAVEGVVFAKRWAAPKRLMDARLRCHAALAGHQYLTCYLMENPVPEIERRWLEHGAKLRAAGRWFSEGTTSNLQGHQFLKGIVSRRIEVSPEALPFRPGTGVFVVIKQTLDAARAQEIARWHDEVHVPDMCTVEGVTGAYWFQSSGSRAVDVAGLGGPVNRLVFLYFLDGDPLRMVADARRKMGEWRAAGRLLDTTGSVETILAGPYVNIDTPEHYDWAKQ